MKYLFTLLMLVVSIVANSATIVSPMPYNIQNGQPADATRVMSNFNQIVSNVNTNAAALGAPNIFTYPQQFGDATTLSQGTTARQVQNASLNWVGTFGGTANALTASPAISPTSYVAGHVWTGVAAFTNTGAATFTISPLASRTITKAGANALIAGDIVAGEIITLKDNGSTVELMNPTVPNGIPFAVAGGTANAITATFSHPTENLTLVNGLDVTVSTTTPNTSTTVTFAPTLNGVVGPAWSIVKSVAGVHVAPAVNDIQGTVWLKADTVNNVWVLQNPGTPIGVVNVPLTNTSSTVTISIASPTVISWGSHGLAAGTIVTFTTTGALPTGITAGTNYYVIADGLTTNSFEISASPYGAAVATSGGQSGTQTAASSGYLLSQIDNQRRIYASGSGATTITTSPATLSANFIGYLENDSTSTLTLNSTGANIVVFNNAPVSSTTITSLSMIFSDGVNIFVTPTSPVELEGMQVFSASGTWTKPNRLPSDALILVEAWGGGGGGSSVSTDGGGGGGYSSKVVHASDLPASVTVTIGAGGAVGNPGGNGGNTTFGSVLTAGGGGGAQNGTGGGAGGGGTGANLVVAGTSVTNWSVIQMYSLTTDAGAAGGASSGSATPSVYVNNNGGGSGGRAGVGYGTGSIYGGGGGSSDGGTPGGPSIYGGAGGATGQPGVAPGGGGGQGGNGAPGRCRVTILSL
jgi:hypothetical protein